MRLRVIWAMPLLLVTGACDRKAEGQTVAVVNKEEITATELNAELKNANLPPNVAAGDARGRVVEALVDRRLLAQQAKADGLDKSPEFLNQQRQMTDTLLINMLVSRRLNTMPLPTPEEVTKFEADHPEMFAKREIWTLQQLQYQTPKDPAVLAKIQQTKTLDQLAAVLRASGAEATPHTTKVDSAIFPQDVYNRVAALPAGEPFIVPGGDRSVASVIVSRESAPQSADQGRTATLNAIRRSQSTKILEDLVKSAKRGAKIEYQKGFAPPSKP
jgi:peptidyl-prolyl cis-trans isomerase C